MEVSKIAEEVLWVLQENLVVLEEILKVPKEVIGVLEGIPLGVEVILWFLKRL